jgi:hypothetical protein
LDFALRKEKGELRMGLFSFGGQEKAGGFFVETVDDAGPVGVARKGADVVEKTIGKGAGPVTRGGMND